MPSAEQQLAGQFASVCCSLPVHLQACKPGMPCYYSAVSMAAMCAAYLLLFALSAALAIPGGLFMPSLLLGGLFGAVCGLGLREALPEWHIEPGLYALCSATATLGGVFRTRCVCACEGCNDG
jgi:chloride channel 7